MNNDTNVEIAELIAGPAAWLDSWAQHVGSCQGGYVCTCGLSMARMEVEKALALARTTSLAAQDDLVDALRVIAVGEGCMNGIREELSAAALRKIARAALASIEVKS